MSKLISVIIPVYNAAKYVKEAVNSVLKLKEVFEIILIEDGSIDSSYELCLEMSNNHDKIILLSHPNNKNRGPSASRNRGIEEARGELIAFLDADDYYLSNRFENALDYFSKSKEIDMIYESILFKSGNDKDVSKIYFDANSNHFEEYFLGHKGWLHLNGITFRKRVFEKIGLFDLDLRLTQDTDLILRSFINVTFHGINKEPVAVLRNHPKRRSLEVDTQLNYRYLFYQKWYEKAITTSCSKKLKRKIVFNLISNEVEIIGYRYGFVRKLVKSLNLMKFIIENKLISKLL